MGIEIGGTIPMLLVGEVGSVADPERDTVLVSFVSAESTVSNECPDPERPNSGIMCPFVAGRGTELPCEDRRNASSTDARTSMQTLLLRSFMASRKASFKAASKSCRISFSAIDVIFAGQAT